MPDPQPHFDLRLPASSAAGAPTADPGYKELVDPYGIKVRSTEVAIAGLTRDDAQTVELAGLAGDELLELQLRDGLQLWMTAEELGMQVGALYPAALRGGTVDLAQALRLGATRGGPGSILERVKRLDVDLGSLLTDGVSGAAVAQATRTLVERMDLAIKLTRRLEAGKLDPAGVGDLKEGLFAVNRDFGLEPRAISDLASVGERPILLFLHGTHSNTEGSFGGLRQSSVWPKLWDRYPERVFALEHRTLSRNPAENARDLLSCLSVGAKVHLVTHSRGGLVGEWLCLAPLLDQADFTAFAQLPDRPEGELAVIQQLAELGSERDLQIERFVRVAGPGLGTLLAGDRLSRYFSVMLNLFGLVPGLRESAVYPMVQATALALIKLGFDAKAVPGLACLRPDSPYVERLHRRNPPRQPSSAKLTIVAGDHGGKGILGWLGRIVDQPSRAPWALADAAAELFFREPNDLVVHTRSMFAGLPRADKPVYAFRQSESAHHLDYFRSAIGQDLIEQALLGTGDAPDARFVKLEADTAIGSLAATSTRASADAPVLILVPDFMASRLVQVPPGADSRASGAGQVVVWPERLGRAELKGLRLPAGGPAQERALAADGVIDAVASDLHDRLAARFELRPYAYDWRRSPRESAGGLADLVVRVLAGDAARRVHVVAQGLGATVVAWLRHDHPEAWAALRARGGRAVLAGPLSSGSYEMLRHLTGESALVRAIALQTAHPPLEVAKVFATWPGLLACLPSEVLADQGATGGDSSASGAAWRAIFDAVAVSDALLKEARTAQDMLAASRKVGPTDPAGEVLLLGTAPATAGGVQRQIAPGVVGEDATVIAFTLSRQGDGVATWERSTLPGLRTYFVGAPHAEILAQAAATPALAELIENGQTALLGTAPPQFAGRGEADATLPLPELLFPSPRDVLAAAHLVRRGSAADRAGERFALRVEVVHGDLANASYPVAVGHFEGSTLAGAEAVVDGMMQGRLTRRQLVGLHPGEVGQAEVILVDKGTAKPGGCLVVGLGAIGELTPQKLTRSFTEAALRYATLAAERGRAEDGRWRSAAISTVLIGAGTHALGIETSIEAIVRAVVDANERLMDRKLWDEVRIDALQFVELYAETAIRATQVVGGLAKQIQLPKGSRQVMQPVRHLRWIGRGRSGQPGGDYNQGTWQPVTITSQAVAGVPWWRLSEPLRALLVQVLSSENPLAPAGPARERLWRELLLDGGDPVRRDLYWSLLGTRARAEQSTGALQRRLVDRLIEQATRSGDTMTELRVTLYELLLPNAVKVQSGDLSNLVLELDDTTAHYPWELLSERLVEPIAVRFGVLRRLRTERYRERVRHATSRTALVIGDPASGDPRYPSLAAARREAETVRAALERNGYEVTLHLGPEVGDGVPAPDHAAGAMDILNKLFQDDYRVLHIAAHGRYDPEQPIASGVVIGKDTFLTAAEIGRLRVVPELVFLNCCHLGTVGTDTPSNLPRLAASLARELIEMGVRAVVAAGWAVDDRAAQCFAEILYQQLLEGEPFGEAVLHARRTVFQEFGEATNTWGAYQCYGDPSFRLAPPPDATRSEPREPVARRELETELESMTRTRAMGANPAQAEALLFELRSREALAEGQGWFGGRVWSRFGAAYAELGDFEAAIRCYNAALKCQASKTPLSVIEQLANLNARQALQLRTVDDPTAQDRARDLMADARRHVAIFLKLPPSAERKSLAGSLAKREAMLAGSENERRRQLQLRRAAGYYKAARDLVKAQADRSTGGGGDAHLDLCYPTLNWLTCRFLLGESLTEEDRCLVDECLLQMNRDMTARDRPDFWTRVAEADASLLQSLIAGGLGGRIDQLQARYESIFAAGSSPKQRRSVEEHIAFLAAMLRGSEPSQDAKVVHLDRLRENLARFDR